MTVSENAHKTIGNGHGMFVSDANDQERLGTYSEKHSRYVHVSKTKKHCNSLILNLTSMFFFTLKKNNQDLSESLILLFELSFSTFGKVTDIGRNS